MGDAILVAVACALMLLGVVVKWRERAEDRAGARRTSSSFPFAWNLFLGLAMLCGRLPHLAGASHEVVAVRDPLSALLALIAAVLAFRGFRRAFALKRQRSSLS
ncbi:hypothetical protein [Streptacidiphilus carbonis]|uniref:hypothetical protein n=1 Tax=Streptacidiphilus carbonis TaxID=105422 RepID=UPI00126A4A01|nr:hypothetical protein [Streptacidiphilus carbonis]